jgi:hypothetical protein
MKTTSAASVPFIKIEPTQTYTTQLNSPTSKVYYKIDLGNYNFTRFLPSISSCTGRVNVYGLACYLSDNTTCVDSDNVPSEVNNDFQFVDNYVKHRGQKTIVDFDMCNDESGVCLTKDVVYYLMVTPAQPFSNVKTEFKLTNYMKSGMFRYS